MFFHLLGIKGGVAGIWIAEVLVILQNYVLKVHKKFGVVVAAGIMITEALTSFLDESPTNSKQLL